MMPYLEHEKILEIYAEAIDLLLASACAWTAKTWNSMGGQKNEASTISRDSACAVQRSDGG
jgi:hypothetical protein